MSKKLNIFFLFTLYSLTIFFIGTSQITTASSTKEKKLLLVKSIHESPTSLTNIRKNYLKQGERPDRTGLGTLVKNIFTNHKNIFERVGLTANNTSTKKGYRIFEGRSRVIYGLLMLLENNKITVEDFRHLAGDLFPNGLSVSNNKFFDVKGQTFKPEQETRTLEALAKKVNATISWHTTSQENHKRKRDQLKNPETELACDLFPNGPSIANNSFLASEELAFKPEEETKRLEETIQAVNTTINDDRSEFEFPAPENQKLFKKKKSFLNPCDSASTMYCYCIKCLTEDSYRTTFLKNLYPDRTKQLEILAQHKSSSFAKHI